MKTSELIGPALDWAVAKCVGVPIHGGRFIGILGYTRDAADPIWFQPSTNWSQGGPIIERERIQVFPHNGDDDWAGVAKTQRDGYVALIVNDGPTPLIAAMRCYCASKLGDEVEIPEELQ